MMDLAADEVQIDGEPVVRTSAFANTQYFSHHHGRVVRLDKAIRSDEQRIDLRSRHVKHYAPLVAKTGRKN